MKEFYSKTLQLILFVCFFSTIQLYGSSQNIDVTNLTLNEKGVTLVTILNKISNVTHFNITYGNFIAKNHQQYNAVYQNKPLTLILEDLGKRAQFDFKVNGNEILIGKIKETNKNVLQQKVTITGIIVDEIGEPLPGASILEKGTSNGVTTDFNGGFSLKVSNNKAVIVVSYLGFVTKEVPLEGKKEISVRLIMDSSSLDEVVIVGYGSVKKSDLTGSVSSIDSEDLVAFPVMDATQALQGRAAGVTVQATNGAPGSGYSIQIRGNTSINAGNDPLIVVDGFIGGVMPPAEDIESMEILKDASSTAIYGARGANGVVIISTSRGTKGKTQFSFSSSYSTQKEINRLDLLNADQFTSFINELDPSFVPEFTGEGIDWQDQIYRTGGVQNYQLSASGGTEKVNYYLSGSIFDQKGIVENSDFNRYSITSNLDLKVSESVKLGSSIFVRRTNKNGVKSQEGGDAAQTGVISGAYKFSPTQGVTDENGDNSLSTIGYPIDNPYALAKEYKNETITDLFQGNVYAEVGLFKDLKFKSTLGVSINQSRTGRYYPTTLDRGNSVGGEATFSTRKSTSFINENYLTYNKTIGKKHDFSIMAGYSLQKDRSESSNIIASGFISDSFSFWNLGGGTNPASVDSELSETAFEAFFGRINYTLDNKYLFTFTGRQEGASVFAANNK